MALFITKKCIHCDMCEPQCPNNAILMSNNTYKIHSNLCTECKGYYKVPVCQEVCPIPNAIIKDPTCTKNAE